jgi:hypothetical protein
MDILNTIIKENANVALSEKNIVEIIDYYGMLENITDKMRYLRTVMECMNNNIIEPDIFLQLSILRYMNPTYMSLIAISIRYGAENKYVTYENIGNIHIMVYTVMELMGKRGISNFEIETILCIMSLLGFSTASRAYIDDNITVAKWLTDNGFFDFLEPMDFLNSITDEDYNIRISIGTMCDIPDVAFPIGYDKTIITEYYAENGFLTTEQQITVPQPSLYEMILNNSYKCAECASIQAHFSTGELEEIKICIDTGALEIFDTLISRGFNFSYFSMTRLLVALKNTAVRDTVDRIFSLIYINMIKTVVKCGVSIDKFQFNLLNNFSLEYANEIEEMYKTPLWQKVCSGSNNVALPKMVKELAVSLNIDGEKSKPEICSDLRTLASVDFSSLSAMELERQREQLRLSQSVANRLNKKYQVFCKNAKEVDPLRYTDNTLIFYTDKNSDSWCFTAGDFEQLVATPINPITNEKLPQKLLDQMQSKVTMFKNIGVNPSLLKPYDDSLKDLYKKDKISNVKTLEAISIILNLASSRGILEARIRSIPYSKMIQILHGVNMQQDYFIYLPHDFQFAIFCKILNFYFKKNPYKLDDILEIIKY